MDLFVVIIISIFGFIASLFVTPKVENYMRSIGKVGNDVHKVGRPEVAESGGIGFMLIFLLIVLIGIIFAPSQVVQSKLIISLIILASVVALGLIDDFKGLSGKMKPLLLIIVSLPVFIFRNVNGVQVAVPRPILPFVGPTNLTIAYWALAIFVVAVPSNASNMLDVMNGVMSFSGILILFTAFLTSFIIPLTEDTLFFIRYMSLGMIGVLLGFWLFNKYPAQVFAGDTGSLGVGAVIGLIAIYGRIEFVMVVALLVHIMNSFSIISSVGGLRERREMKDRPVYVENGIVYPSKKETAPITLVRLIVAREPAGEKEIVQQIIKLVLYCCLLALISAFVIRGTIL